MSVPAPFTTLTLTQGATTLEVDIHAAHSLDQTQDTVGGFALLRAQNGRGIRQFHYSKREWTFSGSGSIPPGLESLDFADEMTLNAPTVRGSPLTVFCDPPAEQTDVHGAIVSWSLNVMEG